MLKKQGKSAPKSYQLLILVDRPLIVEIGKLGTCSFPAGVYVYTGSAKRNLELRIARHFSVKKKLRWHIDHLLTSPHVKVVGLELYSEDECMLNQNTKGTVEIPLFGATDCRAGCGSHLKFLGKNPFVR